MGQPLMAQYDYLWPPTPTPPPMLTTPAMPARELLIDHAAIQGDVRVVHRFDRSPPDVNEAERQVLALGARRVPDPPDAEDSRVYADPAGHPCLVFNT